MNAIPRIAGEDFPAPRIDANWSSKGGLSEMGHFMLDPANSRYTGSGGQGARGK